MLSFFRDRSIWRRLRLLPLVIVFTLVASHPAYGRVLAEDRLFLPLTLQYLDGYTIDTSFQDTVVGGLSGITYDRQQDCYYAISDDRANRSPARFYTLKLDTQLNNDAITISDAKVVGVTYLKDETGQPYSAGTIDGEAIAISPRRTLFISSEGNLSEGIAPFIGEFDLATGKKIADIPLPQRYLPDETDSTGMRNNLAFESLAVNQTGLLKNDPFRLFAAVESSLKQDLAEDSSRLRFLHYSIDLFNNAVLVAEHLYLAEPAGIETIRDGLTELYALRQEGYFLSLERTVGFTGAGAKIFQVVVGDATDTSTYENLKDISSVRAMKKRLLLDLKELGIYLDNLEGMTMGGMLPDGSQALVLVSDNNFNDQQTNQLLLFRVAQ